MNTACRERVRKRPLTHTSPSLSMSKILKLNLGTDLGPSLLEPSHKGLSGTIEVGHVCTGEYADVVKEAEVGIVTDC
jgi:hypothetical protein